MSIIVEFCGVPGGGKSTLIRNYVSTYPKEARLLSIDMYKRFPELAHGFLFAIVHPIIFFWMVYFVATYHVRGLFLYSFHLAFRACAKYQKAAMSSSSELLFLDEGILHVLFSLPGRKLSKSEMKASLRRALFPDVLCAVTSGDFHRFHTEGKAIHPRVMLGSESLKKWEEAVRLNVRMGVECVRELGIPLHTIEDKNNVSLMDTTESLHNYLAEIKR